MFNNRLAKFILTFFLAYVCVKIVPVFWLAIGIAGIAGARK
jgi:hypothetical protein